MIARAVGPRSELELEVRHFPRGPESRYLLCSPLSIREIAEHFRFSSEYYFSNFFKRHTGTTPSAFRKANLHAHSLPL